MIKKLAKTLLLVVVTAASYYAFYVLTWASCSYVIATVHGPAYWRVAASAIDIQVAWAIFAIFFIPWCTYGIVFGEAKGKQEFPR